MGQEQSSVVAKFADAAALVARPPAAAAAAAPASASRPSIQDQKVQLEKDRDRCCIWEYNITEAQKHRHGQVLSSLIDRGLVYSQPLGLIAMLLIWGMEGLPDADIELLLTKLARQREAVVRDDFASWPLLWSFIQDSLKQVTTIQEHLRSIGTDFGCLEAIAQKWVMSTFIDSHRVGTVVKILCDMAALPDVFENDDAHDRMLQLLGTCVVDTMCDLESQVRACHDEGDILVMLFQHREWDAFPPTPEELTGEFAGLVDFVRGSPQEVLCNALIRSPSPTTAGSDSSSDAGTMWSDVSVQAVYAPNIEIDDPAVDSIDFQHVFCWLQCRSALVVFLGTSAYGDLVVRKLRSCNVKSTLVPTRVLCLVMKTLRMLPVRVRSDWILHRSIAEQAISTRLDAPSFGSSDNCHMHLASTGSQPNVSEVQCRLQGISLELEQLSKLWSQHEVLETAAARQVFEQVHAGLGVLKQLVARAPGKDPISEIDTSPSRVRASEPSAGEASLQAHNLQTSGKRGRVSLGSGDPVSPSHRGATATTPQKTMLASPNRVPVKSSVPVKAPSQQAEASLASLASLASTNSASAHGPPADGASAVSKAERAASLGTVAPDEPAYASLASLASLASTNSASAHGPPSDGAFAVSKAERAASLGTVAPDEPAYARGEGKDKDKGKGKGKGWRRSLYSETTNPSSLRARNSRSHQAAGSESSKEV
eukprot:TRINITY_DN12523_c0_g2_i1.p1 TRINITY_DN12523_c0_g2~~TRINITY_DN12523_c0_g2_i1.p1  ORF type:complete len:709 (+),score=120.52 TRINITY_DN12523_c0_g2_i1:69-2195(+)